VELSKRAFEALIRAAPKFGKPGLAAQLSSSSRVSYLPIFQCTAFRENTRVHNNQLIFFSSRAAGEDPLAGAPRQDTNIERGLTCEQ
jgi:hypothetical protein